MFLFAHIPFVADFRAFRSLANSLAKTDPFQVAGGQLLIYDLQLQFSIPASASAGVREKERLW